MKRLALLLALAAVAGAETPPTPASVLGFEPGADRRLADWPQVVDYFRKLDAASPRVLTEEVGRTTDGAPFLVVTITSEANMARLEEIRRGNLRLADPRGLAAAEAEALLASGKAIVALNHGIHSNEVGPTQASLATAYRLATDQGALGRALDDVVVLMLPSHNPDGMQQVVEWYRKTLGTPFEGAGCVTGCRLPFLYHRYTGHDNNRDWYAFTQVESRLTVQHLYDRWRPQIVHDLHQMGATGARIFLPPYTDPWEPNVDPALTAAVNALGSHVAAELTTQGKPGVVTQAIFDAWTPARGYPHTHGGVRLLSELASAAFATPLEVKPEQLRGGNGYGRERSWNHPQPWTGGPWRLADIVAYEVAASESIVKHAAANREYWLRTMHGALRRAALRTDLFAYLLPVPARDPHAQAELLRILRTGAVEVHRARAAFRAGEREYAAGTLVVKMQQPFSSFAKTVLEAQRYPDRRLFPEGPPIPPYDVTAHTLPLLLGVDAVAVETAFEAELDPVTSDAVAPGTVAAGGPWLALGHATGDLAAAFSLLSAKVPLRWAADGALLAPASTRARVQALARARGVSAAAVGKAAGARELKLPRVGLYRSARPSMDEGWTRFVFEKQVGVPYATLADADVRAGQLRQRFDAIVLPDQAPAALQDGWKPGELPDEYTGGLGAAGRDALRAFVDQGGTLVALNEASLWAIAELELPVRNALADLKREQFYCPGALLRAEPAANDPLLHGLAAPAAVWFEESPAFEVFGPARAILTYPATPPLLSGWLLGGEKLAGKAALVEVPKGRGKVVLFGFRPQYRAQSWATYAPFLNALLLSAAAPEAR